MKYRFIYQRIKHRDTEKHREKLVSVSFSVPLGGLGV